MTTVSACLSFLLLTAAGAASAQTATPEVSFNAAVVSDYVFRGFSQSDEGFAIQGGVDVSFGSTYVGAWASNVEFGDSTEAEVDLYGGYQTDVGGVSVDVGAVVYLYVNEPAAADYNYVEFKLALSKEVGDATLGGLVYFSPDFYGADKKATYVEANAAYALTPAFSFSGAIGHQTLDVGDDYTTWNFGGEFVLVEGLALDVRYHDTDVDGPLSEGRVVASLKAAF